MSGDGVVHHVRNAHPVSESLRAHHAAHPHSPTHVGPNSQTLVITSNHTPIKVEFNGRVRSYSRHEIAKLTESNTSHISMIFAGKRNPSLNFAIKLAHALGVTLDFLINDLIPLTAQHVTEVTNAKRAEYLAKR